MNNELDSYVSAYSGDNIYDFDNEIMLNWYASRITKFHNKDESVLELGLGHGFSSCVFENYFNNHIILEGSAQVIDNFKKTHQDFKSKIIKTYFEDFKSNKKFDLIIMGFILEHVDDPIKILKYFKKFLMPEGYIYVAVPNAEVMSRRLGNIAGILSDIKKLSSNDLLLGHKRYYTIKTITNDIKNSGLEVINFEGIYLKPLTTSQILSLKLGNSIIMSMCELGIYYPELSCGILLKVK